MADLVPGDLVIGLDPPGTERAPGVTDDDFPRWVVVSVDPPNVTIRAQGDDSHRPETTLPLDMVKQVEA